MLYRDKENLSPDFKINNSPQNIKELNVFNIESDDSINKIKSEYLS